MKNETEQILNKIVLIVANHFDDGSDAGRERWNTIIGHVGLRQKIGKVLEADSVEEVETSTPVEPQVVSVATSVTVNAIEVIEPPPESKIITMTDRLAPVRSLILSPDEQVANWVRANDKFGENRIPKAAFKALDSLIIPILTPEAMEAGYVGATLSCGLGGKGTVSNMVLSGKVSWEYIASARAVWKWDQIDFNNPKHIRPFSRKHSERPVGFYWKLVQLGHAHQHKSVQVARGLISQADWGMGPEGIQFLLTHPHYVELMDGGLFPFMDLPDFKVSSGSDRVFSHAPYLRFNRATGKLDLHCGDVSQIHSFYGSGSLR